MLDSLACFNFLCSPIAQVLVSFGATVDLSGGRENWTPLCYSAMAGHVDLVEFYLTVGANPEVCVTSFCVSSNIYIVAKLTILVTMMNTLDFCHGAITIGL